MTTKEVTARLSRFEWSPTGMRRDGDGNYILACDATLRAVNAYDDLVAACQRALREFTKQTCDGPILTIHYLTAALAKAGVT